MRAGVLLTLKQRNTNMGNTVARERTPETGSSMTAGGKVNKDADIMQWAISWAAELITNYQVGEDGIH